jgi:DNA mismatch repair protein MutS2
LFLQEPRFLEEEELAERHALIREMEGVSGDAFVRLADLETFLPPLEADPLFVYAERDAAAVLRLLPALNELQAALTGPARPLLSALAQGLPDGAAVAAPFRGYFTDGGELRPDATPGLKASLRRERACFAHLQDLLQQELQKHQPLLSDEVVMYRRGRYCLPVKAAAQGKVQGMLLGASATRETVFIEPAPVVVANNDYQLAQEEVQAEKARIMKEITDAVRQFLPALREALEALARLDFLRACRRYQEECGGVLPEIVPLSEGLTLQNARHPLLEMLVRRDRGRGAVIPLTFAFRPPKRAFILSGPNGGGKTIALQTAGLVVALARMGLPVPAGDGTRVPAYDTLLVSVGDAQDLDRGLSTFTSSIAQMREFLETAGPGTLCLVDEIGFGTNPEEAAALSLALLDGFLERGAAVMVTTHLTQLKSLAFTRPEVANASMEFDEATHLPTFRFLADLPGSSNALEMAERFGLPGEVLAAARRYMHPDWVRQDALLKKIQALRQEAEETLARLQEREREAEAARERAKREAAERDRAWRQEREALQKALWAELHRQVARLREEGIAVGKRKEQSAAEALVPPAPPRPVAEPSPGPLAPGQAVAVRSLNKEGRVVRVQEAEGTAVVEVGGKHFWFPLEDLAAWGFQPAPAPRSGVSLPAAEMAYPELNLIGLRVEEAEEAIERFLSHAALTGLRRVVVVHGHGTGRLRRGVRAFLKNHALVQSFTAGDRDATTVVEVRL